jgi:hypothetical protein
MFDCIFGAIKKEDNEFSIEDSLDKIQDLEEVMLKRQAYLSEKIEMVSLSFLQLVNLLLPGSPKCA